MKQILTALLALSVVLSLAACGRSKKKEPEITVPVITEAPTETTVPPTTVPPTTVPETTAPTVPETFFVPVVTEPEYDLDEKFKRVDETVYATRNVNIRTQPNVNSRSPGKLMKDESVKRIGKSHDGWSAVIYKDELYYIASEYLTTDVPAEKPQSGGSGTEKVTESPASGTLYTTAKVNFRKGPGTDTKILSQLPEGAKVTVLAKASNGWYKVSYDGTEGYVAGGYLTDKEPEEETKPTEKPTEPATKPSEDTKPTEKPTEPATKPGEDTEPTEKPTEPTTKPGEDTKPEPSESEPSEPSESESSTDSNP